jgi:ABC-type branched-subunit amino acid transport system ATPase component
MDSILDIQGISKSFGGLQAVNNFDLQVNEKDLIGIIGPNGAGKPLFLI